MKTKKIFITFIISIIILILFVPIAYANGTAATINPEDWQPSEFNSEDAAEVMNVAGTVVAVIRAFGIVVSVVVLLIIGIKYMLGSVEEKADYKTSMKPYLIGVFIFFGLSQLISIIIDVAPTLFE